jgi:hypothetical protein
MLVEGVGVKGKRCMWQLGSAAQAGGLRRGGMTGVDWDCAAHCR